LASEKLMGYHPGRDLPKSPIFYPISCQNAIYCTQSAKEVISIQHYETTDIYLGAFLLSNGGNLSGITFNDRQIATFVITGKGIHQLDRDYQSGRALVNPVHLRSSLNHLRDLLFDMRDRRRKKDDKPRRNRQNQARR